MGVKKWTPEMRKKFNATIRRKRKEKREAAKLGMDNWPVPTKRKSLTEESQPNLSDWDIAYVYGKTEAFIEFYAAQSGISGQALAAELGKLLQSNRKRTHH